MALAALIGAYQEVRDGDALRATLPVAGHLLVEHQARQAAQAGAGTVILLVERVPAPLAAAVDRLRRGGLTVDVARSVADAADRIHPDERLLLVGDGIVADQRLLERMVAGPVPAVLALPDELRHQRLERIDASTRWGGLLLSDGARLRHTAAMLGEWDLVSTLLRRTLQEQAERVEVAGGVALVDDPEDLDAVRDTLIEATRQHASRWTERFLHAPIEELVVPRLLRAGVQPLWAAATAIALSIAGALAFLLGALGPGFLALLLSLPVGAVARRLGRLRLDPASRLRLWDRAQAIVRALALVALATALYRVAGWGVWAIAGGLGVLLLALQAERMLAAEHGAVAGVPQWLADDEAVVVLGIPFAASAHWVLGLAAAALYAAISLLALQARELRAAATRRGAV